MSPTLPSGLRVAHFRIDGLLGAGGMGEVYRAWDTKLDRAVALKVLPQNRVADSARLERFAREAKSASALAHPHIVTIYEIGQDEVPAAESAGSEDTATVHYIAMELIEGATLRKLIHEERVDLRSLLRSLAQAAEGVARAHEAGVVHRDLKPDNIMVTREGYAKVLDFGLAKLDVNADPDVDLTNAPTIQREATQEGVVLGTVGYMSPEQVQGRVVDHRTDVFAFGCLLYEAATRRRPFTANSSVETMHRILRDEPQAMEQLNPDVPEALRRLVKRCLAKEPERRFQSMKDVALELTDLVEEFDSLAPVSSGAVSAASFESPPPAKANSRLLLWLGLPAAALALVTAVWLARDRTASSETASTASAAQPTDMQMRELTTTADVALVAISPDGNYLAQARWMSAGTGLWITHIATGSSVEVVAPEGDLDLRGVTFTPDGNYLVFVRSDPDRHNYSSAFQVPVLGGEPRRLLFDVDGAPSFSPDGTRMAFLRGAPQVGAAYLIVANADATDAEILAETKRPDWFELTAPAWSPDGSTILAIQDTHGGLAETVVSVDATTGQIDESPLSRATFANIDALAWLPDGSGIIFTGRQEVEKPQIWMMEMPGGSLRRLTNDLSGYTGLTVTADSRTIVSRHETMMSQIWISPADRPNELRALTTNPRDQVGSVAVGPDGTVFFERFDRSGSHIWRTAIDGGAAVQLTHEDDWHGPEISADGSMLLALRRPPQGDSIQLWRLDPETGQALERLVAEATNVWSVTIAPDASWVAVDIDDGELWIHRFDGSEPRRIADQLNVGPLVSPDGNTIAYLSFRTDVDGTGVPYVELITPEGEGVGGIPAGRVQASDGAFVDFSPSGKAITAHQFVGGITNLWNLPLDGSEWVQLTDLDHGTLGYISDARWSPDGKWLVVTKGEYWSDAVLVEGFR